MKVVICFSKDGTYLKEYQSVLDTEKDRFINGHVSKVCNGIRLSHRGLIFKYKDNG